MSLKHPPRPTVADSCSGDLSSVGADDYSTLLAVLPAAPARILLSGAGLEPVATVLRARGYELTQAGAPTKQTFPADAEAASDSYHAVVIGQLAPDIDALTLFSGAYDALTMGGKLVLLASAVRHAAIAARGGVNPQDYLAMVATRHGFSAHSADAEHGPRVYVKSASPRWRVSPVRANDVQTVLTLFRDVFGHEMSPAHWQWKYGEGRGSAAIARRDGAIVAHYGGVTRPILLFGQPARAFQICDVMVDLKERAVLTKSGPFSLTAASFAESAVTARTPFGYGFPNARVMRLAERTGLYTDVGGMTEIRWQPLPDRPRLLTRVQHLSPDAPGADEIIDRLWREMTEDLRHALVGVRDARYVRHRYFNHPDKHYDVLVVTSRLSGAAHGILVLRRDEGRCELLDVIAPLKNLPTLIDQARRLLAHWRLTDLHGWITQQHAGLFVTTGGQQHPLDIRIPTSNWIDGPVVETIRDKWWLMAGDTDFR